MAVAVGDKVFYAPDIAHYLDSHNGQYVWICGWQQHPMGEVDELTNDEMIEAVKRLYRRPKEKTKLVPLRPATYWNAVVRAVNGDGTLNLDIDYCLPGVTHSYDNVARDDTKVKGGTWHLP